MSNLKLRIGVLSAQGLAAADKTGYSDPYVVFRVDDKKYTTKVVKQTLDPVWNYEFEIPIGADKMPKPFNVTVWDKDTFGRDFLGEISIPVKNCFDRNAGGVSDGVPRHYNDPQNLPQWFTLNKRSEKSNITGEVQIKFGFIEQHVRDPQQYVDAWEQLFGPM